MTEEIWKDVNDSNGQYKVSNTGKVMSFKRNKDGEIMKGYVDRDNYTSVAIILHNNPKSKPFKINRLVATHFISNPNNYTIVDHIDGNRQNDCVENLRWVNRRHNSLNSNMKSSNTNGIKGIFYHQKRDQWGATFYTEEGKSSYKLFKTKEEAIEYRLKMVALYYPSEYYKHGNEITSNTNVEINKKNTITNFKNEIWVDIEGYNRDYKISNYCRVKSLKHDKVDGKFLKPNKHGIITLMLDNIPKYFFQHRLCAIHFIPNPNSLPIVDHIDGNIHNNHVDNLRWVSHQQNSINSKLSKNNTSNYKGVSYAPKDKLWVASWYEKIGQRKRKSFKIKEDAIEHRKKMVEKYYESDFYIEDR